jgi:glycosyltransferase involved in cell wall biosynthesis
MNRTRVAYCIDSFDIGGTELNAVRLAEALDPDRFELSVCHLRPDGPLRPRYEAIGATLHRVSIPNLYSPASIRAGIRLAAWLRRWNADIVHTHDIYSNIFAAPWVRVATRAVVLASRRWWYDVPRSGLVPLNRLSYRFAHRVLANSPGVAQLLQREERIPEEKIVQVPNFVSEPAFQKALPGERAAMRNGWGVPDGAFVVGSVARLAPVKNQASLLRAAALLGPEVHIVLVGDGPSRPSLEKLSAELGLADRVHFTGTLSQDPNPHQFFDISVLCSRSEGFPNTVIEALASARAVVATAVGGVKDVIADGSTGMLVTADDDTALAAAIQGLYSDAGLRRRLGEHGQNVVRARFHERIVVGYLMGLYEELVERHRKGD